MKILKKPKMLPVGCRRCGCLYKPKLKNLQICDETQVKDMVACPFCKTRNRANFDIERSVKPGETYHSDQIAQKMTKQSEKCD